MAEAIYIPLRVDGEYAYSEHPDELVALDFDRNDRLIGIELIGSAIDESKWHRHEATPRKRNA
jgi:hypothetical protein